jgi:prophage tail gpP-like protein
MAALSNLNLQATIVAGGQTFPGWESIEIWREFAGGGYSFMKFRAAEKTDGGLIPLASQSLDVGDQANGFLCGQLVITGHVMSRQVVFDRATHAVEIIVVSNTQSLEAGTVQGKPGQYINQTVQQIATSAAGTVGVKVRLLGDLSGTELPFPRISEHIGERLIDFIARLAGWRNLNITDDEQGNLCLVRGQKGGTSVAQLQEGRNLESCRMVKNNQWGADPVIQHAQAAGTDANNGTAASANVITKSNPNYVGPKRTMAVLSDNVGGKNEMKMALDQTVSKVTATMWEVVAVVPGWQMDDGRLWILACIPAVTPITIYSPMLEPKAPNITNLVVKGIKHLQDSEQGTRTEVTVCLAASLGSDPSIQSGAPLGGGDTAFANDPTTPATNAPGGPGTAR